MEPHIFGRFPSKCFLLLLVNLGSKKLYRAVLTTGIQREAVRSEALKKVVMEEVKEVVQEIVKDGESVQTILEDNPDSHKQFVAEERENLQSYV